MTLRDRHTSRGTHRPMFGSRCVRRLYGGMASRRAGIALLLGSCLLLAFGQAADARSRTDEAPPGFRIVVHPENPESFATREFVSDAFLKKTNRWPDGALIRPVDHRFGSAVREAFSESILRRSAAAVRNYWQQRIFAGRGVPPPEVVSDAEVIRYVREHQGGIGYVSAATDPSTLKVLSIR